MFNSLGILLRQQHGECFFVSENQHGCLRSIDDNKVTVTRGFSENMCLMVWRLSSCQLINLVLGSFRVKTKNKRDRRPTASRGSRFSRRPTYLAATMGASILAAEEEY